MPYHIKLDKYLILYKKNLVNLNKIFAFSNIKIKEDNLYYVHPPHTLLSLVVNSNQ